MHHNSENDHGSFYNFLIMYYKHRSLNLWASLVAHLLTNLPVMQETQVWSLDWEDALGWEDPLATHSIILAWRIPWTEEPGRLWSIGLQRIRQDWATKTFSTFTFFQGSLGSIGVPEHKQILSWSGKLLNLFCEGKIMSSMRKEGESLLFES